MLHMYNNDSGRQALFECILVFHPRLLEMIVQETAIQVIRFMKVHDFDIDISCETTEIDADKCKD